MVVPVGSLSDPAAQNPWPTMDVPIARINALNGARILKLGQTHSVTFESTEYLRTNQDVSVIKQLSSVGPTGDFNIKPDIAAHGIDVHTTALGGYWGTVSGTR